MNVYALLIGLGLTNSLSAMDFERTIVFKNKTPYQAIVTYLTATQRSCGPITIQKVINPGAQETITFDPDFDVTVQSRISPQEFGNSTHITILTDDTDTIEKMKKS